MATKAEKSTTSSKKKTGKKKAAKKKSSKKKISTKKTASTTTPKKKKAALTSKIKRASTGTIDISAEERWRMIAVTAYLKAEARDFSPGHETEDWLQAEKEVDALIGGKSKK